MQEFYIDVTKYVSHDNKQPTRASSSELLHAFEHAIDAHKFSSQVVGCIVPYIKHLLSAYTIYGPTCSHILKLLSTATVGHSPRQVRVNISPLQTDVVVELSTARLRGLSYSDVSRVLLGSPYRRDQARLRECACTVSFLCYKHKEGERNKCQIEIHVHSMVPADACLHTHTHMR